MNFRVDNVLENRIKRAQNQSWGDWLLFLTPINKYVNTYKQNRTRPINTDVKDILKNNNKDYNNWRYKSDRDFTNFDFDRFYANNF